MSEPRGRILIVDDEPNIRKLLAGVLTDEGYAVDSAGETRAALAALEAGGVDLVLLDVMLPGVDGIAFLSELKRLEAAPAIVMMSGHGNIQTAVEATRLGAVDFLEKPIKAERLLLSIENALHLSRLRDENRRLRLAAGPFDEMIGSGALMKALRGEIARVAGTAARVLITGENGTGKELVARALHAGSARADRPFVKVNCAAIPAELLESELFGHERGAFTGAVSARRGKFELAQGGTLLLDEIGDMNPSTQAKLLRVLEENEMERLGGEKTLPLNVRVFASTNQDLEARMQSGEFRRDLFHRLKVVPIVAPTLRARAEDIAELATHFLARFCAENGRPPKALGDDAAELLRSYSWPGNVRELKNLMERVVIMIDGASVSAAALAPLLAGRELAPATGLPLAEAMEAHERRLIEAALAAAGGNVAEAARRLGLDRGNLHRKLQRLGLRELS